MKKQMKLIKDLGIINLIRMICFIRQNNCFVYNNSFLNIDRSSSIRIIKGFHFNKKWVTNDYKKPFLILGENSSLEVDDFSIYSGANISVSENATLKFGSGYINHSVNIACF